MCILGPGCHWVPQPWLLCSVAVCELWRQGAGAVRVQAVWSKQIAVEYKSSAQNLSFRYLQFVAQNFNAEEGSTDMYRPWQRVKDPNDIAISLEAARLAFQEPLATSHATKSMTLEPETTVSISEKSPPRVCLSVFALTLEHVLIHYL